MAEETKEHIFKDVDCLPETNNVMHHTSEMSLKELIVRRGQPFTVKINLTQPFNQHLYPLVISAMTGSHPTQEQGTLSFFSIPDGVERSPSAKAVWKVELDVSSSPLMGNVTLIITPPADTPIGEYILNVKHKDEETLLAKLVVLFNPWCPEDWVYLKDENEINEYVMNEQGVIFKGSKDYIFPLHWDFGQFEDNMVQICLRILDLNHKHAADPGEDVSARCNPIYVGRVVSAMINCEDDRGVLQGRWGGSYKSGRSPSYWNGSYLILKQWFNIDSHPVKFGQCWVFAGVMCSVMRLLGIPCRVVSNFKSAHDSNKSLTIDVYHLDYGVKPKPTLDSIWNFHVWLEAWMKRPDLEGSYDGWQVLDPTPQEKSEGVYCCGPTPVKAILEGQTDLKYDIPFVFAEVNADCIDWLVKADGSKVNIFCETAAVGHNISTKSVGSKKRLNITDSYKHREGTEKERSVFKYALTRDYSVVEDEEMEEEEDEEEEENEEEGGDLEVVEEEEEDAEEEADESEETEEVIMTGEGAEAVGAGTGEGAEAAGAGAGAGGTETNEAGNETRGSTDVVTPVVTPPPPPPPVTMHFEEVTPPTNGKDVRVKLVLQSKSSAARPLSINISIQAMIYNGSPAVNIQKMVLEHTLHPETDLSIPIRVPFLAYHKHMVECDSIKMSALVTDKERPDFTYLAEDDIVLLDPPITVTVSSKGRLNRIARGEVVFMNPVKEKLTQCTLTLSGSGLLKEEIEVNLPDMKPNIQIRVKFYFIPYKLGEKTLVADFNCSTFRDIKGSVTVTVKP